MPLTIRLKIHGPGDGPCVVELRVEITHDGEGGQPYDVDVAYIGRFGIGDVPDGLSRDGFARQNAAMAAGPSRISTLHFQAPRTGTSATGSARPSGGEGAAGVHLTRSPRDTAAAQGGRTARDRRNA